MSEHNTTTTHFIIEAKDRLGNWHPVVGQHESRSTAETVLANQLNLLETYYTEAKISKIDVKTSITTTTLKHIDIFSN